jgi:hypothetical protein
MAHGVTTGSRPGTGGTSSGGQSLGATTPSRQGRGGTAPGGAGLGGTRIPGLMADGGTTGGSRGGAENPVRTRTANGAATRSQNRLGGTNGSRQGLGGATRGATAPGGARIPGVTDDYSAKTVGSASAGTDAVQAVPSSASSARTTARLSVRSGAKRYATQIPSVVTTDFVTMAKHPLARSRPLYQDVARTNGVRWELLAACDWMQCKAQPQYSPVRGERLGAKNPDGTRFRTKSEALEQAASDLIVLADAVYQIDLTAPMFLSVLELAQVFAAFRWGGLLRAHRVSAMEFPYSVEGLTVQHMDLRWPDITEPNAPDKPGARFRMPFGAVPVVLSLNYPAVA